MDVSAYARGLRVNQQAWRDAVARALVETHFIGAPTMHADPIQNEIEDKGLTAPRVHPEDLEAEILSEHYFTAENGASAAGGHCLPIPQTLKLLTFCVLVLKNSFTVVGKSACVSAENFDAEIGRKVARQDAINQMWPLLGFRLADRLHAVAHPAYHYRDAATGEYVSAEYAAAHPGTTVRETDK